VAVDVARRYGADVVIAVDISGGLNKDVPSGVMNTMQKTFDIMYAKNVATQLKNADVVIRPKVEEIGSADMEKFNKAIFEGEMAATAALPEIRKIMDKLNAEGRLQAR
jgi:NTE family protein